MDFADLLKKLHFHVSLTLDGIMDSFNEKMCRITKKLASKKDCCCSNTLQSKNEIEISQMQISINPNIN